MGNNLKKNQYDWWIVTKEIKPPIAGVYRFVSIAVIYTIGSGEIQHGLGEFWGETKDESDLKMREKVNDWLRNNSVD